MALLEFLEEHALPKPNPPANVLRLCPVHYRHVLFSTLPNHAPRCPEGHQVDVWWCVDVKRGWILAAASLDTVVLAFEQEKPTTTHDRQLAVSRGAREAVAAQ